MTFGAWLRPLWLGLSLALAASTADAAAVCKGAGVGLNAVRGHLAAEELAGFSGTALIDWDGQRLEFATKGFTVDGTRFWIASVSKTLTVAVAARLAERGEVKLETRVSQVFPTVSGDLGGRTLAELLGHRAGLKHVYAADGVTDRAAAVQAIAAKAPGAAGFSYSNDGFSLAAAMIEQIAGQPFDRLVAREVLKPAGMDASGSWGDPLPTSGFAPFRRKTVKGVFERGAPVRNYGYLGPTGIYSTAADMMRFLTAMKDESFLGASARARLWTPGWTTAPGQPRSGTSYGLGWALDVDKGKVTSVYHGGDEDWLGHSAQIRIDPERRRNLVILSNAGEASESQSWSARVLEGVTACLAAS